MLAGAARIAPVGLAYRDANNIALLRAVTDAVMTTHTHQTGTAVLTAIFAAGIS